MYLREFTRWKFPSPSCSCFLTGAILLQEEFRTVEELIAVKIILPYCFKELKGAVRYRFYFINFNIDLIQIKIGAHQIPVLKACSITTWTKTVVLLCQLGFRYWKGLGCGKYRRMVLSFCMYSNSRSLATLYSRFLCFVSNIPSGHPNNKTFVAENEYKIHQSTWTELRFAAFMLRVAGHTQTVNWISDAI